MSRQNLYLLISSTFLLIFVLVFAFFVLIPKGSTYRVQKIELYKATQEYSMLKDEQLKLEGELAKINSNNKRVIDAYENSFDADEFKELNSGYFDLLNIKKISDTKDEDGFSVYEISAVSNIDSPKNFYDFLDSINSTKWIILVNFPINFKRDGKKINSSFTMKVYSDIK
ncbi:MAG: hypothetical protein WC144_03370 [Sulfurimonas sp.]|jgi:hypothetical protein|nr:hypothetical protein [Sulfurimonadaceae bacterium]